MRTFIDVDSDDWYYNEITEAANYVLSDGKPLVTGYRYSEFQAGQSHYYNEFVTVKGQKSFALYRKLTPTTANPLFVYINGAQAIYSSIDNTTYPDTTIVFLAAAPSEGSVVSFFQAGIPLVDAFNRPAESSTPYIYHHPAIKINVDDVDSTLPNRKKYVYNPLGRNLQEYLIAHGRKLRRVSVDDSDWKKYKNIEHFVAEKYIGDSSDVYICSPSGKLYVPFNLNNVTCTFQYAMEQYVNGVLSSTTRVTQQVKPGYSYVYRNDRFFPNAYISRAEAFTLVNRLRRHLYKQYTDKLPPTGEVLNIYTAREGQRVYKTDGQFVKGGELLVFVNGTRKYLDTDYIEFDNHTIVFNTPPEPNVEVWIGYSKYPIKSFYLNETIIIQEDDQENIHLINPLPFRDGVFNTNFMPTIKLNTGITLQYGTNFTVPNATDPKLIEIMNIPIKQGDVITVTADYNFDDSFEETFTVTAPQTVFNTQNAFPYRDTSDRDVGGQVKVYVNNELKKFKIDYNETANNQITFYNPVATGSTVKVILESNVSRFSDIGGWGFFKINGTNKVEVDDGQRGYWVEHVIELEYEQFDENFEDIFVLTSNQQVFTTKKPFPYKDSQGRYVGGKVKVYVNNVLYKNKEQYDETSANQITFKVPVTLGSVVKIAMETNFVEGKLIGSFDETSGYPIVNSAFEILTPPSNAMLKRYFLAKGMMSRAEVIALFNRFRKWSMDRFK